MAKPIIDEMIIAIRVPVDKALTSELSYAILSFLSVDAKIKHKMSVKIDVNFDYSFTFFYD